MPYFPTVLSPSGNITGAVNQAQSLTNGMIAPLWKPASNATNALEVQDASGAMITRTDTTNKRVGIGGTPRVKFDITTSAVDATSTLGVFACTGVDSYGQAFTLQVPVTSYSGKLLTSYKAAGGSGQAILTGAKFLSDLVEYFGIFDSSVNAIFAVEMTGKIRTNQATTNTNTPSGATAQKLPIYNIAGTLLGYIPVYASAW